jgi:hypothetical protein
VRGGQHSPSRQVRLETFWVPEKYKIFLEVFWPARPGWNLGLSNPTSQALNAALQKLEAFSFICQHVLSLPECFSSLFLLISRCNSNTAKKAVERKRQKTQAFIMYEPLRRRPIFLKKGRYHLYPRSLCPPVHPTGQPTFSGHTPCT